MIKSGGSYNYAINGEGQVYSWGMGVSYVLGSRNEDTQYEPFDIPTRFFKSEKQSSISLGAQHVVYLGHDEDTEVPKFDESVFKVV
mmetsp:Transcript_18225/g.15893  ORF Transcript_18225/g.15893 Transcript_18225/m.15893 type:complete len:86 (-) Transcript_18225:503-760(-)